MSKTPSSRLKSVVAAAEPLTRPSIKTWSISRQNRAKARHGRTKHGPVQLVEVPLVDQEPVDPAEPLGRPGRAEAGRNEVREAVRSIIEQAQADPRQHDHERGGQRVVMMHRLDIDRPVRLAVLEHLLQHRRAEGKGDDVPQSVQPAKMLQNARMMSGQVMIGSLS